MAEGEATEKDRDPCQKRIEEIEGTHSANADEEEKRALDSQIGEGLMQAFEDPIDSFPLWLRAFHRPLGVLAAG
jgi:hypothetical protein